MREQGRWVSSKFEGKAEKDIATVGLVVVQNFESVHRNGRFEKPFNINGTKYTRGLFCHATSKLIVYLPSAGKRFTGIVGVDTNDQTSGGRGSIVFSVNVDGEDRFDSGLMREGMAGIPVRIELNEAREFVMAVSDGGDGYSCDQADWVDVKVELANGSEIWLGDMPILDEIPKPLSAEPPFSFTCDTKRFADLKAGWETTRKSEKMDSYRTRHETRWRDPRTGLVVRWLGVEWKDFPTVEWTLYFVNEGTQNTPILEHIQALDIALSRGHSGEFLLHHAVGSPIGPTDFQPLETVLAPKATQRICASRGKSTDAEMSYFNLEFPGNRGVIVAVGWPGQWSSEWKRDEGTSLRIVAGQELTHFKLHPGEQVRSPLIVLQFWSGGDWIRAQNIWRRWMLAHNVPRPGGKELKPLLFGCSSGVFGEMVRANEDNQIEFIQRYLDEAIQIDYWWMDAGWYLGAAEKGWGWTGTWEVDTRRFPKGLRAISDYAHSQGMGTIVWFDPERVHPGTWLAENHPEWILRPKSGVGLGGAGGDLLNEGNPRALEWLINHVDKLIRTQRIDIYREDLCFAPLEAWRANDDEDRQGIAENHHIQGHLTYWDTLLERHPNLLIDACAGGGKRLDLETMRRAVPLWRTDYPLNPSGTQCHSYGLSLWIPLSGTGNKVIAPYDFRSNMVPFTNCIWDHMRDRNADYDLMRRLTREFREVAKYYWGDYYPLSGYSINSDTWMAWQFNVPETGQGMVQAFRRPNSISLGWQYRLRGLVSEALYEIVDIDKPERRTKSVGHDLMDEGLKIFIEDKACAKIIVYRKLI